MFQKFPSLTRFSHGWTITEKLDGTNAQVLIARMDDPDINHGLSIGQDGDLLLFAGSRTQFITPEKDNHGFARFAAEHAKQLIETLGEGRHFGEWLGGSIQRGYGLKTKRFALFNTHRWGAIRDHADGGLLGGQLTVVPVLAEGYMDNPGLIALQCMDNLKARGSEFAPGFMDPEGVVMRHNPSGTTFKKTFDYDEQGKWAENQAAKGA